jgi:hypothetical protein
MAQHIQIKTESTPGTAAENSLYKFSQPLVTVASGPREVRFTINDVEYVITLRETDRLVKPIVSAEGKVTLHITPVKGRARTVKPKRVGTVVTNATVTAQEMNDISNKSTSDLWGGDIIQ